MNGRPHWSRAPLSAMASLVFPGLGQLAAGQLLRANAFLAIDATIGVLALAAFGSAWLSGALMWLPVLAVIAWRLWAARDAFRVSRVPPEARRRHGRLAWAGAVMTFVALWLSLGMAVGAVRWRLWERAYKLTAASMFPTLLPGEFVITRPLGSHIAGRGDVVVFLWPKDTTRAFVKRIAGIPGDTLSMRGGALVVNGQTPREPYARRTGTSADHTGPEFDWQQRYLAPGVQQASAYRPSRDNWGPIVVPPDAYFMLGDNRDESADSRYWGFVPADHLFARPWRIYFSRDPSSGRMRWERVGLFLTDGRAPRAH
jgi:signal peptidase I